MSQALVRLRSLSCFPGLEIKMTLLHELIVSARDAEVLGLMLGERRHEPEAARALKDLLLESRVVRDEELPRDRAAMNSKVTYETLPGGERRTVILSYPLDAAPSVGRVSVLSPVGRALLGRAPGARVSVDLPGDRTNLIRIAEGARGREALAA
jgi:transcription elongation GreA/GreB family factor